MLNVIVTGANGFIGSMLTNYLLGKGINVVAIDLSFSSSKIIDSEKAVRLEVGLDDVELLEELIPKKKYDLMYHLAWAGVNGSSKSDPDIQLKNIQIAINCAKLCKSLGINKLLCSGTIAEQSVHSLANLTKTSDGMLYGVAKHCSRLLMEDYCKNIGVQFVWMQFSNIYGVGNNTGNIINYTLKELLTGNKANFGSADQPYDFIYIDDLLEAVYRLGNVNTKLSFYYIGSGCPRFLKDFLLKIGKITGMQSNVCIGVRQDDGIKYDFSMFDTTSIRNEIGEYVQTSFETGIVKTINWLKSNNDY